MHCFKIPKSSNVKRAYVLPVFTSSATLTWDLYKITVGNAEVEALRLDAMFDF